MPISGTSFGLGLAAQRPDAWNGKRHVPKVCFGIVEFDADVGLAIAGPADGNDVAFHRLGGVTVHEHKVLANRDRLLHGEQCPMTIDGLRFRLYGELAVICGFATYGKRHGE